MTDLRDELERIADRAPAIDVSPDLYARGRRAAVRTRLVAMASAAAAVVLVVGLVAVRPWSTGAGPQPADTHRLPSVVPDRIYVPQSVSALPDGRFVTPDPMTAPVVAAYVMTGTKPVAVLIHGDGSYARMSLSGLAIGMDTGDTQAFALSPDGSHLAYYSRDTKHRTSITIVAFGDGGWGAVGVPIGGRLGAVATALRWSDDSRSLVWTGQPITSWTDGLHFATREIAGIIDVGGTLTMLPKVAGGWGGAGVCDGGTAVVINEQGSWSSSGGPATRTGPGKAGVLATGCPNGTATPVLSRDVSDVDGGPKKAVLGWSADGLPVVMAGALDHDTNVTAWNISMLGSGATGPVATADVGADRLTLATGLMSRDHPTASVPRPAWAPHPAPWWRVAAGLGTGVVLAELLRRLWRRRRRDAKVSR